jgi:hypothetical protein
MEFKYLIILLASSIATATADARIVFQQDFVPRNNVDIEIITSTFTSTTISPTTTTMEAEEEEEVTSSSSLPLCGGWEDWCSSPPDYPDLAILAAALRQNNTLGSLWDTKLLVGQKEEKEEKEVPTESPAISNSVQPRIQEFEEFVDDSMINICSVKTEYIMPRAAKNKDGEYKFIVNQPEGGEEYVQQVRVTICRAAEQSCGHGRLADSGLDTKCRQEYSDHKLVSLTATGEELQVETFRFPSCCSCFVSQFTEY